MKQENIIDFGRLPNNAPPTIETEVLQTQLNRYGIIGNSPALIRELSKIPHVAKFNIPSLITGETGTGKELAARAIHYSSVRAKQPFVGINCGAVPRDLVEREFFGHEKGAFTGAENKSIGVIRAAEGGTLFLDELEALPLDLQVKLLRFLQAKEYRMLGSPKTHHANVRIVAATNGDLEEEVRRGRFRQDLYYRLNVLRLRMPALRERIGDIKLLAEYFLLSFCAEQNIPPKQISMEALRKLASYEWPGNVRELENVVAGLTVLSPALTITVTDVHLPTREDPTPSFRELKTKVIADFEQKYIKNLLAIHGGNVAESARSAKLHRRALWRLISKYAVNPNALER